MNAHPTVSVSERLSFSHRAAPAVRPADRWLAILRIVVGLWFLKAIITNVDWVLVSGIVPMPRASQSWIDFLPVRLRDWAEINPLLWYRAFLVDTVIPSASLFANLTAFGEIAVGFGLTLGLLTRWASLLGLFLAANYFLASAGRAFDLQGFHVLLIACMVSFFVVQAGRTSGLDSWLIERLSGSRMARLLLL